MVPKSLRSTGRFLVDQQGRVVVLHGTNQIRKLPPYTPSSIGFGADDADQIVEEGFNTIRLGFIWKGLEPEPGQYDTDYLADLAGTVQLFTDRGVHVLFDMHQDMFNERYNGEGFPDWLLPDDEVPPVPDCGFPLNYFVMPALGLAYDNLFADEQLDALGRTPSEAYAEVWTLVAEQFRDDEFVFGYDVFNEPYPGADYPPCFNPRGLPGPGRRAAGVPAGRRRRDPRGRPADGRLLRAVPDVQRRRRHEHHRRGSGRRRRHRHQLPRLLPGARRPGCRSCRSSPTPAARRSATRCRSTTRSSRPSSTATSRW